MIAEEIRGHIVDVLARDGANISRTLDLIKRRVNGATSEQLLAAAVAVLREQISHRIAELGAEVDNLASDNARLQDEVGDLEAELKDLRARSKEPTL